MGLVGTITPTSLTSTTDVEIQTDWAGLSRLTTPGHSNIPNPVPPGGYAELTTGLGGQPLGEINFAFLRAGERFVLEALVSSREIIGEVRDGVSPVQVITPLIKPGPDGTFWTVFALPAAEQGHHPELRLMYRQTWPQDQTPPETSWIFVEARLYRYDP